MHLGTIRTHMDVLRMRYGRAMDTSIRMDFMGKNMFDFSVMPEGSYLILGMSIQTVACHYRCHKDIMDITDNVTDQK